MQRKALVAYLAVLLFAWPLLAQRPPEPGTLVPAGTLPAPANRDATGLAKPDVNIPPFPTGQAAVAPPVLVPGQPGVQPPRAENLVTFDPRQAELQWVDNRWQLRAGAVSLKDFGRREAEARQALRLVRELHLTQHGTVGTPQPVLEYWLANGQAPQGSLPGLRLLPLDPDSLHVEQVQGQWCLRNTRQILFNFGRQAEDAHQALAIVRRYGFSQVGYVGQPLPTMIYFLGQPTGLAQARTPAPATLASRTLMPGQTAQPPLQTQVQQRPPFADPARSDPSNTLVPPPLPFGRQLASTTPALADLATQGERVPFDWRRVQVRQENQDWKLVAGGYTLANFGTRPSDARQALAALQYYRFTEQRLIGSSKAPTLTYYLVNGQAPRGLVFGVESTPFRPELVSIQRAGESYVLWDGNRAVWNFGEHGQEAQQALNVIQRHQFDHLCRIGSREAPAMTFLVRTR